jgi:hypothetical protein
VKTRDHVVKVRLSSDELETAEAHARSEGVPLSTYLRRLAVTARPRAGTEAERVKKALRAFDAFTTAEVDELRANVAEVRKGRPRGRR